MENIFIIYKLVAINSSMILFHCSIHVVISFELAHTGAKLFDPDQTI